MWQAKTGDEKKCSGDQAVLNIGDEIFISTSLTSLLILRQVLNTVTGNVLDVK